MSKLVKYYGFDINNIMKHKHHIIPRHMGGTDDPSNLIELTVEEHADAHKKLYEEFGRWQDYVAWQGLSKLDESFDAVKQSLSEAGKRGAAKSNLRWQDPILREKYRKQQSELIKGRYKGKDKTWAGKTYEITTPSGVVEVITGLKQWCDARNFNANTFANACLRGTKTRGGYTVRRI